ncbi:MAG: EAL domain-containing protein [Holdemania massiliensis]
MRWSRKDGTQLPPDDFIPLFEENGFIHELDFYMLKQVCRFIRERNLQDHFMISVNFSRVTIHHRDFYEKFHTIVDAYAIPARCLQIEITESAFNGLAKTVLDMLNQLKREGFILSIDDFGSGYSSLNLLNTLMMDEIKIDRVFLNEENARREQIIGLIVDIAATLEIDVICEGVETQADVDMLRRLHCGRGQGFYLSRPLPEQEFADQFLAAPVAAGE